LQLALYVIILLNVGRLSLRSSFSPINAALVFSPAFVLFPVYDFIGGFRKEIILIALMALLASRLADDNYRTPKYLPAFIGIACVFVAFSHEMLAAFMPYVICIFLIRNKKLNADVIKIVLFIVPSILIAFLIMVYAKGNITVVADICTSLGQYAPKDCLQPKIVSGAITSLGQTVVESHAWNVASTPPSVLWSYVISALFGFAPVILVFFSAQFMEMMKDKSFRFGIICCALFMFIASLVLLWVFSDLGRFIYIHVSCLSILALMMSREEISLGILSGRKQILAWMICFVFIISWRLIYYHSTTSESLLLYNLLKHIF